MMNNFTHLKPEWLNIRDAANRGLHPHQSRTFLQDGVAMPAQTIVQAWQPHPIHEYLCRQEKTYFRLVNVPNLSEILGSFSDRIMSNN
jgi:hypothetical protein